MYRTPAEAGFELPETVSITKTIGYRQRDLAASTVPSAIKPLKYLVFHYRRRSPPSASLKLVAGRVIRAERSNIQKKLGCRLQAWRLLVQRCMAQWGCDRHTARTLLVQDVGLQSPGDVIWTTAAFKKLV